MKFQPRLKGVRLLWMTAGILLILVIGGFSKLYFVDTQSLKQTIEQSLSETAELPIHIQSIQFQWARGLGLKINNFTIRSGDGKRIILAAEHILLQPEILPLIYGEFRIKRANVHHPVARIYLDMPVFSPGPEEAFPEMDQPLDSDLTGDSREARAPEKEKSFLASLLDDPEAEAHEISTADAKDESLVESLRSIIRKYHRSIKKINVLDGIVHVIKRHDKKNTADQPIHIDFQIQLQRMGTQRIDATLENVEIQLGNLRVYGTMMAKDVLTSKGILAIDLKSEQFDASELQHILYFMPVDLSRQVRDYPLSGKFDELTVNASIPLDVVDHFEKFNQTMRGRIRLQAKQIATRIGKVRLPIDRWTSDGIWAKGKIHHMIDIATLGGKLSLNGVLKFRKDTKGNELPFIKSKLEIHQLNLAKMKTPSDWGSSRGKITGKINFAGPLFPPKSIRIDGIVNGQNLQVIPEDQPFTVKKAQIQFSNETGTSPKARIQAQGLVLQGVPFKTYSGRLAFPQDRILFLRSVLRSKHGKLGWKGTYHTRKRRYDFKLAGRGLKMDDFAGKYITGNLDFSGKAHGTIHRKKPLTRGLSGKLAVRVTDGSFRQWESARTLLTVINPTSVVDLAKQGMAFKTMWGHFQLDEGMVETRDLSFESRRLKIYLQGHWDVPTGDLLMNGKALPSPDIDRALKSIPIVGKILAGGTRSEGLIETYFKVRGKIEDPEVNLLTGKSLLEKPKRMFRNLGRIGQPTE